MQPLSFAGIRALAPMVRVGTLPMRLLARDYGADVVWGPEIIDKRIIASRRVVNDLLGTVDYVCTKTGALNFRCTPREQPRLVFQLGTADPALALQAALMVRDDVAAIDVNCGCPKTFSVQGGMGAALLSDPDRLCAILTNLVEHCGRPVTAKIRLLASEEDTVALVSRIVDTGIVALTVHCRTRNERPQDPGHWDAWKYIVKAVNGRVPVIGNGDIFEGGDMDRAIELAKIDSVMLARSAQSNPSVFRHPEPLLSLHDVVIPQYIRHSIRYDNIYQNTKYVLMQMVPNCSKDERGQRLQKARSLRDIAAIWGLEEECDRAADERERRRRQQQQQLAKVAADGECKEALGDGAWNDRGGIETEFPHVPNAPYIPQKRTAEQEEGGDTKRAAVVVVGKQ
ncbi:tRNA-dihydrouridine synthase 2 [Sorochytrium milnesiophthora]